MADLERHIPMAERLDNDPGDAGRMARSFLAAMRENADLRARLAEAGFERDRNKEMWDLGVELLRKTEAERDAYARSYENTCRNEAEAQARLAEVERAHEMTSRELQRYQSNFEAAEARLAELRMDLLDWQEQAEIRSLGVQMASEQRDLAFEENERLRARLAAVEAERDDIRTGFHRVWDQWAEAETKLAEVEADRDQWQRDFQEQFDRAEAAEARLAEAIDAGAGPHMCQYADRLARVLAVPYCRDAGHTEALHIAAGCCDPYESPCAALRGPQDEEAR